MQCGKKKIAKCCFRTTKSVSQLEDLKVPSDHFYMIGHLTIYLNLLDRCTMMKSAVNFLLILLAAAPMSSAFVVSGGPRTSLSGTTTTQLYVETTPSNTDTLESSSEQLLAKAKDFVYNGSAFFSPPIESYFSEEFVFRGPIIGPLNKKDYLFTLGECFKVFEAFPDVSPNAWGFSIDPENPNRVWFMVRITGTFEKDWTIVPNLFTIPANGIKVKGAPETYSILFDDDMKVKALTVGYVADRFEGNTNGFGAAFGMLQAVGYKLPSPPNPLFRLLNELTNGLPGNPKAFSKDVPKWWPHEGRLDD